MRAAAVGGRWASMRVPRGPRGLALGAHMHPERDPGWAKPACRLADATGRATPSSPPLPLGCADDRAHDAGEATRRPAKSCEVGSFELRGTRSRAEGHGPASSWIATRVRYRPPTVCAPAWREPAANRDTRPAVPPGDCPPGPRLPRLSHFHSPELAERPSGSGAEAMQERCVGRSGRAQRGARPRQALTGPSGPPWLRPPAGRGLTPPGVRLPRASRVRCGR